jgi:hypothetical protein
MVCLIMEFAFHRRFPKSLQDLREPLRKAVKNKKDVIRTIIAAVRDTCVDWPRRWMP